MFFIVKLTVFLIIVRYISNKVFKENCKKLTFTLPNVLLTKIDFFAAITKNFDEKIFN